MCSDPDHYESGLNGGDDNVVFASHNSDTHRSTNPDLGPIRQDQPGDESYGIFGSAHPGGLQMAMCDGSLRLLNYDIDPEIHRVQGTRAGGEITQ